MDKAYEHSEKVFWRYINDCILAINNDTNELIVLNSTGAAIWLFMVCPREFQHVVNFLAIKYNIEPDIAKKDADEFLSSLSYSGFIKQGIQGLDEMYENEKMHSFIGVKSKESDVIKWTARNLIPYSVDVEITRLCNLHCTHCYLSEKCRKEIDLQTFEDILKQLKDTGTLLLTLTGGEPLLHSDLESILEIAISKYGFSTTIFTNGTVKRKGWKNLSSKYSFKEIHVSLYSMKPNVHDKITGIQGSQLLTLEFIENLRLAGVRVVIKSPLFKQTIGEATRLWKYAEKMGADWSGGPLITPRDNRDLFPTTMRADPEQIVSYFKKLEKGQIKPKEAVVKNMLNDLTKESPLACLALSNSCFIDVNGDLYPCSQIRQKSGNVLETNFRKLWYESPVLVQLREIRLDDLKECSNCKMLSYCSRCPGLADLEGKDLLGKSPFDCILAQCREKAENYE